MNHPPTLIISLTYKSLIFNYINNKTPPTNQLFTNDFKEAISSVK